MTRTRKEGAEHRSSGREHEARTQAVAVIFTGPLVFTEIYRKVSTFSFAALFARCLHAKSLQSCPTLCDSMDCSPSGSSVHGLPRQEYWNGLPFPSPGDLLNPGIKRGSLMSPALAAPFFTTSATNMAIRNVLVACDHIHPRHCTKFY